MGSTVGDVGITPFGVQSFGVSDQYGALTLETLPISFQLSCCFSCFMRFSIITVVLSLRQAHFTPKPFRETPHCFFPQVITSSITGKGKDGDLPCVPQKITVGEGENREESCNFQHPLSAHGPEFFSTQIAAMQVDFPNQTLISENSLASAVSP